MERTVLHWDDETNTLYITFTGRIDTMATKGLEKRFTAALEGRHNASCIVDAEKLGYISSAGIRILIGLRKLCRNVKIIGVSLDIYDIFSMTGVTNLMTVERRIRKIRMPMPGMLISKGVDADVYHETEELALTLFAPGIPIEEAQRRCELSKIAISHGIPTPIAFEVVSCEDRYGIIYEHIHGQTLEALWKERGDKLNEEAQMLADLMRMVHRCAIGKEELPDAGERILTEIKENTTLTKEQRSALLHLTKSLRPADIFFHGNLRLSNILVQDDRLLLLDLTRCGRGNPILDLQSAASAMHADGHDAFWERFFARYTADLGDSIRLRLEQSINPKNPVWWS